MPWNPSTPDTLGMEFAPSRVDSANVGSEGAAYVVAFTAEATRTLPAGGLGAGMEVTAEGDWTVELYREADYLAAVTDTVTSTPFAPTADRHWSGIWSYPNNVQPWSQWLTGAPGTGANTNFVVSGGPSIGQTTTFYAARFGTLAMPAGQRLLALRLQNDREIANVPDPNNVSAVETPFADCADATLTRNTGEERIAGLNARQTVTYTFRPRNVLATADHAAALAPWGAAGSGFGWILTSYSGGNLQMNAYHLSLVVDRVPERRLAWGNGVRFGGTDASGLARIAPLGDRWTAWLAPGGVAPTITAGQRYVLVLRGPKYADRSPFVGRIPVLTPGPPISGYTAGPVRFTANGLPTQAPPATSAGAPLYTGTPTSGPAYPPTATHAVDAMPYPRQGVQPLLGADVVARQRLAVTAPADVGQVVIPVARPDYLGASPLVVRITDNATPPVPVGGAFFLTTDAWDAAPGAYVMGGRTVKTIRASLPSPVTLTAGTWWIEASTADSHPLSEATPWGILFLESFSINAPPGPPNAFQPPSPDLAPYVGGRMSSALAVDVPDVVSGFAATRTPAQLVAATEACSGLWDTAVLTWNATALAGARFWRYEIERLDTPEVEGAWQRLAHVEDPARLTFTDREARRGVPVRYRIRQMRLDGGTSAWVEAPAWTPLPRCCGIGLVTNAEDPASLFFTDTEPLRTFTNLDADALVLRPVYGEDYQLAFRSTERRGVTFETQLLVRYGPGTAGLPEWDALRELARSPVAVAVLTERGDRIWAAITVPELTYSPRTALQVYYAALTATEVTDRAPLITVPLPPVQPLTVAGTFHMGPHANDKLDSNFFMGFG